MSRLARLSLVTTALAFLTAAVGGLVRATDSGLGCPGWPKCYGRWIPPADHHAWIEMTHRYLVMFLSWAVVLTCVSAVLPYFTSRGTKDRRTLTLGLAIVPLVVCQALLGAYVVSVKDEAAKAAPGGVEHHVEAWTVVAHLGLGMAFAATLIALTVHLTVPRTAPAPAALRRFLGATAAAVYVQLLLGSYVTGRNAGLAFLDWPLHGGRIIPEGLGHAQPALQLAHRLWAYTVAALIMMAAARCRRTLGPGSLATRFARVGAALVVLQIAVGAMNVWTRLHSAVVTTHLTVATLIWGAMWTTFLVAGRPGTAEEATVERVDERVPVAS